MSYDLRLVVNGDTAVLGAPHGEQGGTYCVGDDRAKFNVTYNYAPLFYKHLDTEKGLRWLYGKQANDTLPKLLEAIVLLDEEAKTFDVSTLKPRLVNASEMLGAVFGGPKVEPIYGPWDPDDYWTPTPSNAAAALRALARLAVAVPLGVWEGD